MWLTEDSRVVDMTPWIWRNVDQKKVNLISTENTIVVETEVALYIRYTRQSMLSITVLFIVINHPSVTRTTCRPSWLHTRSTLSTPLRSWHDWRNVDQKKFNLKSAENTIVVETEVALYIRYTRQSMLSITVLFIVINHPSVTRTTCRSSWLHTPSTLSTPLRSGSTTCDICEAAHHCYMGLSDKNWSYTQSLDRKQNNHNLLAGGFLVLPELDHHSVQASQGTGRDGGPGDEGSGIQSR